MIIEKLKHHWKITKIITKLVTVILFLYVVGEKLRDEGLTDVIVLQIYGIILVIMVIENLVKETLEIIKGVK